MPWVRIDEHALNHIKIFALSHGAFRLWVEGLAHCQKHLTDGRISAVALRSFRYLSRSRLTELTTPGGGYRALWEPAEGVDGYVVHDYLQWNDPKEKIEADREKARVRWGRFKQRHGNATRNAVANALATCIPVHTTTTTPLTGVAENAPPRDELSKRAGNFCEWYAETHERIIGVAYIGNPHKDYSAALEICKRLNDLEARDAALVWFGSDDPFATNGTRTIPKFASRASDCLLKARRVSA